MDAQSTDAALTDARAKALWPASSTGIRAWAIGFLLTGRWEPEIMARMVHGDARHIFPRGPCTTVLAVIMLVAGRQAAAEDLTLWPSFRGRETVAIETALAAFHEAHEDRDRSCLGEDLLDATYSGRSFGPCPRWR